MSWLTQSLVLDRFTFLLTKSTLPNQQIAITTPSGKKITFLRKSTGLYLTIMTIHSVCQSSLHNIPHLYFTIRGHRYHVCAIRMDRKLVDCIVVCFIVLNYLLRSQIKGADGLLSCTGKNQLISGMEVSVGNRSIKAIVFLYLFPFLYIPNE
jgi:hypothetical protein